LTAPASLPGGPRREPRAGSPLALAALAPFALVLALVAGPAVAQPEATAPPPELRAALEAAQGGDLAGAIARLEELRRAGSAPPQALSMLGALYLEDGRAEEAMAVLAPLA
jgi:hypothetical protein